MMRKRTVGSVTCLHTDDAYASNRTLGAALGKPLDHGVVTDVRHRRRDQLDASARKGGSRQALALRGCRLDLHGVLAARGAHDIARQTADIKDAVGAGCGGLSAREPRHLGLRDVDLDAVGRAVVPLACGTGWRERGDSWSGRVVDAAEGRVVASYETHAVVGFVGVMGRGQYVS